MRRSARVLAIAVFAATPIVGLVSPIATGTAGAARSYSTGVTAVRLNGFEAELIADINNTRRQHGLQALTVIAGATDVARRWSWKLANSQVLSHNPSIVSNISGAGSSAWTEIAENVGEGPSDGPDTLFNAYMASPEHRANILDRGARYIGVGTVERNGVAWNTLDFTNAYNNSYGFTRVPAAGLTMDQHPITQTTDVALLNGVDQRFAATSHGGLTASRLAFTSRGNGNAFTWLRPSGSATGMAGMFMRDALDLDKASQLALQVSASSTRGSKVPVHVYLRRSFGSTVDLGTVQLNGTAQWVYFTLPAAARTFRNSLDLEVSAAGVRSAGGAVKLAVYDVRATV